MDLRRRIALDGARPLNNKVIGQLEHDESRSCRAIRTKSKACGAIVDTSEALFGSARTT
jgi:hypothetical protein